MKKYIISGIIIAILVILYIVFTVARNGFGPGLADYTYKINNSCRLSRSSAHMVTVGCDNIEQSIDPEVITLGWNNAYILATTHPVTCLGCTPNASVTYWWIIDLGNKKRYGPIQSEADFNKQKSNLGITQIELLPVDQAKNQAEKIN